MTMLQLETDDTLIDWVYGVLYGHPSKPGDFLRTIGEAASRADPDNYALMRPLLLELRKKYPKYKYESV